MRILFIGDSIIRGTVGVDWVNDLANAFPEWQITNQGVNGDTLVKINQRLEAIFQKGGSYDYIVFNGGANDLLIPHLPSKGFLFKTAHQHLIKQGYAPRRSMREFEEAYSQTVDLIRSYTNARIIILTVGRMNEMPSFHLNEKREEVNEVIRKIARRDQCMVADAGKRMDEYLGNKETKDYFLENFFRVSWLDRWQCALFKRADSLSEERGLLLTIDGLHLNSIGGAIFRDEVEKYLRRVLKEQIYPGSSLARNSS
ncbi:SGNH/GDSL hydrolase family protein [Terrimonas sp. NA20]|uniref:SGNH/GDSL hydrolase family protein n=1 Tax=Terrimonas ginsenosidimutans TaxID=2908004 RepID=A0ABS9KWD9_9BACT|nr:SGNH/GDSL hydrolase family protein [Terrimonas ginsenosidimutans]MCG2616603.1 SGNH/GDSL hydrolase family protein [Terrimonas ginsenosidimutans]